MPGPWPILRSVPGVVRHSRVTKALPPLGALVASATVHSVDWMNTREGQVQWEIFPPQDDFLLVKLIERTDQPGAPSHRPAQQQLEILEETRSAVGKGVRAQATERQRANVAELAPDRCLDREQEVAPGR